MSRGESASRDLGLTFCRSVPDWFTPGRSHEKALARVDALLFREWVKHGCSQLRSRLGRDAAVLPTLLAAVHRVRSTVALRRVGSVASRDSAPSAEFRDSRYGRLVFGHTNCEGGADLVRQLLRGLRIDARLVETTSEYQHTVVFVRTSAGWAFVDPYADFPVYYIDGFVPAVALRRRRLRGLAPLEGVPEYGSFGFPDGAVNEHGLYPAAAMLERVVMERPEYFRILPRASTARRILDDATKPTSEFWADYLAVRHDHVWRGQYEPADYLGLLTRHEPSDHHRALVEHFGLRQWENPVGPGGRRAS